jgi:hypothetical protein
MNFGKLKTIVFDDNLLSSKMEDWKNQQKFDCQSVILELQKMYSDHFYSELLERLQNIEKEFEEDDYNYENDAFETKRIIENYMDSGYSNEDVRLLVLGELYQDKHNYYIDEVDKILKEFLLINY